MTDGERNLVVATHDGMAICFKEADARLIGRTARGVKAIQLKDGDYVVGFAVAVPNTQLLTVTETGYGRKSDFDEYRIQSRAGKGLINYHTEKYGKVAMIAPVTDENDVIMITTDGVVIRTHADQISSFKRPSKGVKVMRIKDDERLATLSIVDKYIEDEDEQSAEDSQNTEAFAENSEQAPTDE